MKALPNGSIRGRQSKSCDAVAPDIHLFAERASEARCASQRKLTGKEGDVVGVSTEGGNIIPGRKMYTLTMIQKLRWTNRRLTHSNTCKRNLLVGGISEGTKWDVYPWKREQILSKNG